MKKSLLIFAGTFVLGAAIALMVRTVSSSNGHAPAARQIATADALPAAPTASAPAVAAAPGTPVNTLCPICGMRVDPAVPTAQYQGKTVGFGCAASVRARRMSINRSRSAWRGSFEWLFERIQNNRPTFLFLILALSLGGYTAGLQETQRVMEIQNRMIASVPEVARVMGKLGRAESALDPAPIGMIETVVILKPYRDWPAVDLLQPDGSFKRRPRTLAEVRAELSAVSDLPGVAPSWLQPIETRVVMLSTGIRSLVALQIEGDDGEAMERFAEGAECILKTVGPRPRAVDGRWHSSPPRTVAHPAGGHARGSSG
jgi:hypothetical protein